MADEMRDRVAASIQRVDAILISTDTGRLLVRWLGQLAEIARQRNGCPPMGLAEVRRTLAEAIAADSRWRDSHAIPAAELLALGDEQVLGVEETARMLQLKPDTVRLMCREGTLEAKKKSGRWFPTADAVHDELCRRAERSA
jgi:hypothetical protein